MTYNLSRKNSTLLNMQMVSSEQMTLKWQWNIDFR